MSKTEWYRNTEWNKEIEQEFYIRLNRSRSSFNKAQYLRIQAHHLQATTKKHNIISALNLLDLLITKWPDPVELASAYLQKAQCHVYLKDFELAIDAFRASAKAEQGGESIKCNAFLHFGWFAITRKMTHLYDEVLSNMNIPEYQLLFPADQFKFASIYAIILRHNKEYEQAKAFATSALKAMDKKESPFRFHNRLGLVKDPEKGVLRELKQILRENLEIGTQ